MVTNIISDATDLTMQADKSFNFLIKQVQDSRLNFQIQQSPFSAYISLRKSFIKDKNGCILKPIANSSVKNEKVEGLVEMQIKYEDILAKYEEASSKILSLECQLRIKSEQEEAFHSIESELNEAQHVIKRLSKQLDDVKHKHKVNKTSRIKEYKSTVKLLKKEIGQLQKEKKKHEKSKNFVSSTSTQTLNDTSEALESDACPKPVDEKVCHDESFRKNYSQIKENTRNCHHSQQCVIRQPFPPPLPSLTFLKDDTSLYHKHMMGKKFMIPGIYSTHGKCMETDDINQGCSNCRWFKKFGEKHGLPDINPLRYRKHLQPGDLSNLGLSHMELKGPTT